MPLPDSSTSTRDVVQQFLDRLGKGDLDGLVVLFAPSIDWRLSWPERELTGPIPWVRARHTPDDVRAHFQSLAQHNAPHAGGTVVERVLIDGNDAVLLGTIHNVMRRSGVAYQAHFALHLTIEDGRIQRYHIYEDSLAVAEAWRATPPGPASHG